MSFLCSSVFLLLKVLGAILPPAAFTRGAAAVSVTQPEGSAFYMKKFSVYEGICHFFRASLYIICTVERAMDILFAHSS